MLPELDANAAPEQLLLELPLRAFVARALAAFKREAASSSLCANRALFLLEPPSIDAGEITDKSYLNQRQVLSRRAHLVHELYGDRESVIRA